MSLLFGSHLYPHKVYPGGGSPARLVCRVPTECQFSSCRSAIPQVFDQLTPQVEDLGKNRLWLSQPYVHPKFAPEGIGIHCAEVLSSLGNAGVGIIQILRVKRQDEEVQVSKQHGISAHIFSIIASETGDEAKIVIHNIIVSLARDEVAVLTIVGNIV